VFPVTLTGTATDDTTTPTQIVINGIYYVVSGLGTWQATFTPPDGAFNIHASDASGNTKNGSLEITSQSIPGSGKTDTSVSITEAVP
jgi:hypothetical protein